MEYKIYNQKGDVKAEFSPSDNSTHENSVMGDNVLNLSFTLFEFVRLAVNDYVEFEGERYKLMEPYRPTKKSSIEYEYNCSFFGTVGDCKKGIVLKLVDGEDNPTFSLTDTAAVHLQLIVDNINRIKGTLDWSVGQVVDGGIKDIVYENTYCFDALTKLAEEFDTEWWIEGSTINLSRCEHGAQVELGYNNGLIDLGKDENANARFFTRLLPVGSTRNIDPAVYGHKRLQLPGGAKFVEHNTEYGIVEQSEEEAFAHIYPKRIGKVGVVREFPTKIEGTDRVIYYFTDPSMGFNPNDYDMPGLVKNIVFQSGDLNGRNFEVNFDNIKKEFEIILQYPYDNQQLPGGSLIPKPGDEYILYNLRMPTEYYPLAEAEFKAAVDDFLLKYSIDTAIYKAKNDYVWFMENNISLKVGSRVRLISEEYFDAGHTDSRVVRITRTVNNPYIMDIEFSNAVSKGRIESIESNVVGIQAAFNEQLNKEVLQVLKSWDSADPSEYNVFSAIRALKTINKMALRKDIPDTAAEEIHFKKGLFSSDFRSGDFSGAGYGAYADQHGNSVIEVDKMVIRKEAVFNEIIINQINFQGGKVVYSAAYMECTAVDGWKCYFDTKNGQQANQFVVGDQVRCQRFGGGTVVKYYMSIVDAVGSDYIQLSATDVDGSGIPEVGDNIVQFGHRSDPDRQALFEIDVLAGGKQTFFEEVNSYNLSGKDSITMGVYGVNDDRKTQIRCFGEFYVGARDMSQYVHWNGSQLEINGQLTVGAGSSGLENLSEWKEKQQQINNAKNAADTAASAAAEAERKASQAEELIDKLSDDNIISAAEKPSLLKEWEVIVAEKPMNVTQASEFGVPYEDYSAAYTALSLVVGNNLNDLSSDWSINGQYLRYTFKNYYNERTILLNAITAKAKQAADNAQDIADNAGLDALNALNAAAAATKNAEDAAAKAAVAQDRLNTWASDSVISPTEKKAIKDERIALASEKESILNDAALYETISEDGVSTIPTLEYVAAWTQYDIELAYHSTDEPESITIRSEFAQAQTGYYSAKQVVLNLIADASKSYVMSQSYGSKEDIAKNIGFESYVDMIKKAESGNTIIQGGFINTELINTNILEAKNIVTIPLSESDKRHIEITSKTNAMSMFDAKGNKKLIIQGDQINSIDEITGGGAMAPVAFTKSTFTMAFEYPKDEFWVSSTRTFTCSNIIIPTNDSYIITIPAYSVKSNGYITGEISKYTLKTEIGVDISKDGIFLKTLYYNTNSMSEYNIGIINATLPAQNITVTEIGVYSIEVTYSGRYEIQSMSEPPNPRVWMVSSVEPVKANDTVRIAKLNQVTKIFSNGLASVWSTDRYFSVISKETAGSDLIDAKGFMRFMSENGAFGLRMTNNGLLHTDNGMDRNPKWFGMFPGLVYAGHVYNGIIGTSWPDNNGGWHCSRIGTGDYAVTFKTSPFTNTSEYTVLLTNIYQGRYASVYLKQPSAFYVYTADDSARNDSDFCFFVLNTKKWL